MKDKNKLNYLVDFLAFFSFLITGITGLVLFFFLPGGVPQGRYQEFLGILKSSWSFVHDWSGIIFMVLVIIHFVLHWSWIVAMSKNIFKKRPQNDSEKEQK